MSSVLIITDREFESEVLQADRPVLVYFWAPWCGPCRLMAPIIEGLATSYSSLLKVVKMEVDPNPETVARYQIEGVPAFRLIKAGNVVDAREGAISKQKLEEVLSQFLVA